jgi:hypothetical protein
MNISSIKTILLDRNFNFSLGALVDSKMFDGLWFWAQKFIPPFDVKEKNASK